LRKKKEKTAAVKSQMQTKTKVALDQAASSLLSSSSASSSVTNTINSLSTPFMSSYDYTSYVYAAAGSMYPYASAQASDPFVYASSGSDASTLPSASVFGTASESFQSLDSIHSSTVPDSVPAVPVENTEPKPTPPATPLPPLPPMAFRTTQVNDS